MGRIFDKDLIWFYMTDKEKELIEKRAIDHLLQKKF